MMKRLLGVILLLPFLYILQLNWRMTYQPTMERTAAGLYNVDLLKQLQFLRVELREKGAGQSMQGIYPEGYVFIHALYALSWAGSVEYTTDPNLREQALREMRWTIERLESDTARSIFPADMTALPYGVFYQAWLNYTRAHYLAALPDPEQDSLQLARFETACTQIAQAIEQHHTPFLYSYHYGCWPADNVVALATLSKYDQILPPKFADLRTQWLARMREKADDYGLIPHEVNLSSGSSLEDARGSSQSLMLAFWPAIDSTFAEDQYRRYREHFVDQRLGLPGIREYPKGQSGLGDVDAGPVIWEIGGAASVVGMGTAAQYQDTNVHTGLRNSIEGFGLATSFGGKKKYLFGQLPMADAFIAWSHARAPVESWEARPSIRWASIFSLFLPLLLLGGLLWYLWKPVRTVS